MKHLFHRKPRGGHHEEQLRQFQEMIMATFDEIIQDINDKHAEKDTAIAALNSQIAALQAEKDKLTADLAAATAAATAVPALPDGALTADQANQIADGVKAI